MSKAENVLLGRIGAMKLAEWEKAQLLKRVQAKKYTGVCTTPLNQREISKRMAKLPKVESAPSELWLKEQAFEPFNGNGGTGRKLKEVEAPKKAKVSRKPKAKELTVDEAKVQAMIDALKAGKG
jgi:hypothetical protein